MVVARKRRSGARERVQRDVGGNSEVRQCFTPECDVNRIIDKFTKTGRLPVYAGEPFYGDFTACTDYLESVMKIRNAEDKFFSLSSTVRKYFENDPYKFLEFVGDKSNRKKAIELGLISDELVVGQQDETDLKSEQKTVDKDSE